MPRFLSPDVSNHARAGRSRGAQRGRTRTEQYWCAINDLRSEGVMGQEVGIWVDHKKAVIVTISGGHVSTKTLASDVGPHTHYAGSQEGGGEKRYEERQSHALDRYYDNVIGQLDEPDALLLLGPGEAKLQLKDRLSRSNVLSETVVALESTDKLTDAQIVAKVKEHYRVAR